MKVLILHQHFKTPLGGGAIRSYYLAKALVDRGVETVVITAHNEQDYKNESVEGISIHYLPVAYDNRFGFNRRIVSFLSFAIKAARLARLHRDADVCYAISTPLTTGLAARMIQKLYNVPFVFEVGDLWPDAPVQMGYIKNSVVRNSLYRMEKWIYESASSIVALSGPIREAILKKSPGKTVQVIPNMADTDFFKPEEKQAELERKFQVERKFVVSYIGALGVANGLHHFLDCARESQRAGLSIRFLICGAGAMTVELKAYAQELQLDNTLFIPFQNRDGVKQVMNVTDANFICYKGVKILETGSPNKYFDGLAAGKLTIINFGGWIKDEIERERCGVYLSDAAGFVEKIRPFLADRSLLESYRGAGRNLAEAKYSRSMLEERFAKVVGAVGNRE